jgi:hypothetical protein
MKASGWTREEHHECSLFASAFVISTSQACATDDGGVPDALWFVEPGIVHGRCTFAFKIFTWVDFRTSYLAQESVVMAQRGFLHGL